jgi:crotonobetainyl-CoA:carnitine CoA-transferase CaiB-like acyl-CoA transferase
MSAASGQAKHGVLRDVRVVEMGTFITGPACSMHLADLGADVIKVERPGEGDPFRAFKGGLYSPHYQTYNRNKRSIALDTDDPGDLAVLHDLVRGADVFVQNFRPGVAEKIGVGEDALRALNPAMVYCAISGFGTSGPYRDRPVYDTVAQAASGFLRLLMPPDNTRVIGPAIADAVTGFYAALGVLGALVERQSTGKGRRVDVSMLEAMCHFNLDSFTHYFSQGEIMGPYSRPTVSQSYVFECGDGKWLALHMSSPPKFWEGLAEVIGRPNLFDDPRFADRFARIEHQGELIEVMAPIFKAEPREHWCGLLAARGVPHSPVYDSNDALEDAQARHLRIKVSAEHPEMGTFTTVRSPLSFDGRATLEVIPPPTLDEHGAEIRAEVAKMRKSVRKPAK